MPQHKVFISYHHANDEHEKKQLEQFGLNHGLFINRSVSSNDHLDCWQSDQDIREKIRDEHLADTTVTIVLVGHETRKRKHVDWEIYSSMIDGKVNSKSGIIVVQLPDAHCDCVTEEEIQRRINEFRSITSPTVSECEEWCKMLRQYPFFPDRIIDNLCGESAIFVCTWENIITNSERLRSIIEEAYDGRQRAKYNFRRTMKESND